MCAAAGTAGMAVLAGKAVAQEPPGQAPPLDKGSPSPAGAAKLARISIMTYNFNSRLKLEGQPPNPDRILEIFEIPEMYADVYGVHNVELQHSHFASTEPSYLKEFRARIEKVKSRMTQINVEFGQMSVSAPDPVQRYQAIDLTMRWVDHAAILNCPRVMINQGQLTPESEARAIAAAKLMGDYAKTKGVKISVETRGGGGGRGGGGRGRGDTAAALNTPAPAPPAPPASAPAGPPAWELVKQLVEGSGTYSNVDIGGVGAPDQQSLHTAIKGLFPTSSGNMHIKTSPNWDLATAIKFTNNELGYKGLYSIEVNPQRIREVYDTILANI
jgi:Xylose isomerase-like TIM barrel